MRQKKLSKLTVLAGMIFLVGCRPNATIIMQKKEQLNTESQYNVTRVEVFEDELAYGGKRGIYEIIDQRTGKKYLGVSGIGISELGSHIEVNTTSRDEK